MGKGVVMVLSHAKNRAQMDVTKRLYLTRLKETNIVHVVVVTADAELAETERWDGAGLTVRCSDVYDDLWLKVALGMRACTAKWKTARFVLKIDDDVVLNVPRFEQWVRTVAGDYVGMADHVVNGWSDWGRDKCAREESKGRIHIENVHFCHGPAVYFSLRAAALVAEAIPSRYCRLEDVHAGFTLQQAGILPVHNPLHKDVVSGSTTDWAQVADFVAVHDLKHHLVVHPALCEYVHRLLLH